MNFSLQNPPPPPPPKKKKNFPPPQNIPSKIPPKISLQNFPLNFFPSPPPPPPQFFPFIIFPSKLKTTFTLLFRYLLVNYNIFHVCLFIPHSLNLAMIHIILGIYVDNLLLFYLSHIRYT
jgi:hypothetical protein